MHDGWTVGLRHSIQDSLPWSSPRIRWWQVPLSQNVSLSLTCLTGKITKSEKGKICTELIGLIHWLGFNFFSMCSTRLYYRLTTSRYKTYHPPLCSCLCSMYVMTVAHPSLAMWDVVIVGRLYNKRLFYKNAHITKQNGCSGPRIANKRWNRSPAIVIFAPCRRRFPVSSHL